jgi:hypothetical protein
MIIWVDDKITLFNSSLAIQRLGELLTARSLSLSVSQSKIQNRKSKIASRFHFSFQLPQKPPVGSLRDDFLRTRFDHAGFVES